MTLTLTGETLPTATKGVPYSQSVAGQASGGTPPYTFTEVAGGPDIISVSPTGTITFTPGAYMSNPSKVSWIDPTLNVDGSAITTGELTGYLVGVRLASGTADTSATDGRSPRRRSSSPFNHQWQQCLECRVSLVHTTHPP